MPPRGRKRKRNEDEDEIDIGQWFAESTAETEIEGRIGSFGTQKQFVNGIPERSWVRLVRGWLKCTVWNPPQIMVQVDLFFENNVRARFSTQSLHKLDSYFAFLTHAKEDDRKEKQDAIEGATKWCQGFVSTAKNCIGTEISGGNGEWRTIEKEKDNNHHVSLGNKWVGRISRKTEKKCVPLSSQKCDHIRVKVRVDAMCGCWLYSASRSWTINESSVAMMHDVEIEYIPPTATAPVVSQKKKNKKTSQLAETLVKRLVHAASQIQSL